MTRGFTRDAIHGLLSDWLLAEKDDEHLDSIDTDAIFNKEINTDVETWTFRRKDDKINKNKNKNNHKNKTIFSFFVNIFEGKIINVERYIEEFITNLRSCVR